jgi:phosphoribosylformylglycinamidine synthase
MHDQTPTTITSLPTHSGLTREELAKILDILERPPNLPELGIFSAMWSEHCSYKSSRRWLKKLPTSAPWVIQGPGENAGVIDIGDSYAAVFKMESHNHPSFIEPYQGAATGVGGILRDVFAMGARPVANLNTLYFGSPSHPKTRYLIAGVVSGIADYSNCVGIPTLGGETGFHPAYNGNILVNIMTIGIARKDQLFYSAADGIGSPVVYVGSKTGRDGIHGAVMASTEFTRTTEDKRSTVQVGDPLTEKLLLEACLELMATGAVTAIQDVGAGGLASSSTEMADKGCCGMEIDIDCIPQRESNMTTYEIILSESQERVLIVLKPGYEAKANAIFKKWGLDFAVIGQVTNSSRLVLHRRGQIQADLPVRPLVKQAPDYARPWILSPSHPDISAEEVPLPAAPEQILLQLVSSSEIASRCWIWEQYDSMVMGNTIAGPGGNSAIVRVHGTNKALALTADCTPRYCLADPERGGAQAVAEAWRNLTAVGATPLAITDSLNFGNPEKPRIMGQFVGCVEGIVEACKALGFPVVSGNVSFYNETDGKAILPTPIVGGVGIIQDFTKHVGIAFKKAGDTLILVGTTTGHIGASLYLSQIHHRDGGPPPPVNFKAEQSCGNFVRKLIEERLISACHDLSDGGLYVTLAEMAMASSIGADLLMPGDIPEAGWLFGEDQARYLLATANPKLILDHALKAGVPARIVGMTGSDMLTLNQRNAISLQRLIDAHQSWLPKLMDEKAIKDGL